MYTKYSSNLNLILLTNPVLLHKLIHVPSTNATMPLVAPANNAVIYLVEEASPVASAEGIFGVKYSVIILRSCCVHGLKEDPKRLNNAEVRRELSGRKHGSMLQCSIVSPLDSRLRAPASGKVVMAG